MSILGTRAVRVTAAVVGVGALTGCSSGSASTGSSIPATTSTRPAGPTSTTTAPSEMPTLGQLAGIFANGGTGWGQVRPAEISNGGDPTGMVSDISWISWGEAQAIGSGTGDYVGQGQTVAQGSTEAARVIAFDPGMCDGRYMYRAVEWFFPQHGQSFDPDRFEDICTGQYFPLQSGRYTNRTGSQQSGYYAIDATTKGAALTGVLSYMNSDGSDLPVFNFTGTIGVDGSLSIRSSPDTHPSQSLTGSWNTLSFTLDDCARVLTLQSQPPCTFNP